VRRTRLAIPAAVLVGLALAPTIGSPTSASACGSPALRIATGAPATKGLYAVYKGQLVTIDGTGWESCSQAQLGGCHRSSGPPPANDVEVMIVRAAPHGPTTPPSRWRPTGRVAASWSADADASYELSLENVSMPDRSGHYVLVASSADDPKPRTFGWITVL
jgi:hypothetical protein